MSAPVSLRRMPPWYQTLFWADALERFGYYGMQAVLLLFAVAPRAEGGLGMTVAAAGPLFGAWISLMFALSLLGGWLGDRVLGHRPALLYGSLTSAVGYACLALPWVWSVAVGLCLTALGGAVFKPNHQALVNTMFVDRGARESGISLMYVGTQLSALLGPLLTGYLGERVSWPLGFAVGAVALAACGGWIAASAGRFGGTGDGPARPLDRAERRTASRWTALGLFAVAVGVVVALTGRLTLLSAVAFVGLTSLLLTVGGYLWLYRHPALGPMDRRRLRAFLVVFLGAALFWMIIAQAGSVLTAFARDRTDRSLGDFVVPASWLQTVTPFCMLFLAPLAAAVLPRYGRRYALAVRFAVGLGLVGGGFLLMSVAALLAAAGTRVSPLWLIVCYLLNAAGEIIVAAVSISACADVLPPAFLGRVMGMYWLFAAVGGGVGNGALARLSTAVPLNRYFAVLGVVTVLAGAAFALGRRRLTASLAHEPAARPVMVPNTPMVSN
jgi:POT family proton-dependent oligopeptide transporter